MDPKRKRAQDKIIRTMNILDPSGDNGKRYAEMFDNMSDAQFKTFMSNIRDGKEQLFVYAPNMKNTITMRSIRNAADDIGLQLFERVYIKDEVTGKTYLTPHRYPILKLPIRRVSQYLMKKLSVPEGDSKTDLLTGQVIRPDKGSSVSLIEMQTLHGKGLDKTIIELIKPRGGDIHAYAELKSQLEETGSANLSDMNIDSSPRSVTVADIYLKGMHLDNNMAG